MRDPVGRAGAALPEFAQLVELVEAGNAGTDDDRIEIRCHIRPGLAHCRRYGVHAFLSWHRAIGDSWHRNFPPFRSASDWPLKGRGHREPRPASVIQLLVEHVEAHCSASHHTVLGLRRHTFEALHHHFGRAGEKAIRVWVVSRP
jgi:hypothetical protein